MSRVPFEIPEIPLTSCPLAKSVALSVVGKSSLAAQSADLLVVVVPAPIDQSTSGSKDTDSRKVTLAVVDPDVDSMVQGALSELIARREFNAGEGKTAIVRMAEGSKFAEVAVVGLGSGAVEQFSILEGYDMKKVTEARKITSHAAAKLGKPLAALVSSIKAKSVVLQIEASRMCPTALQCLVESFIIAQCPDERFKSKADENVHLASLTIVVDGDSSAYAQSIKNAREVAAGIQLTRELVAAPPNVCNPETLAKAAVKIATEFGLKHKVLGEKECVERKMGSYLAVNQGSIYAPQFIHLTYTPEGPVKKRIVFIGKGICMDTGGYNLKIAGGIETMKFDMGGSAAVFGAARIIGGLKPEGVEVHFIVAAAENMISSKAYRPGDVLTASNGTTIEVGNTDAEGRLTLADALVYAETEVKPHAILDCATLTGACMVGLGMNVAAAYGSDSAWMQTVLDSAKVSGTAIWPMPLFSDYRKLNESKLADLSNVASSRYGGSITAALFLKEFVKETPWIHIDLAGPVWDSGAKEATGYGAKLLAQVAFQMGQL